MPTDVAGHITFRYLSRRYAIAAAAADHPKVEACRERAPARFDEPGARYSVLGQTMLLITLMLGTAGLPHVMNRYFTSPTGREARRTTVWVLCAAGVFYMLAVMLGTAARSVIEQVADSTPWLADLAVDGVLRRSDRAAASPLETDTTSSAPAASDGQSPTGAVGHGYVH